MVIETLRRIHFRRVRKDAYIFFAHDTTNPSPALLRVWVELTMNLFFQYTCHARADHIPPFNKKLPLVAEK